MKLMGVNPIPDDVAAAIEECWPDGVIEEFDADESYFHNIHAAVERDLRMIAHVRLLWQTPAVDEPAFKSYYIFFLAPEGGEFESETETENFGPEDPEDPDTDVVTVMVPGKGTCGCSVVVSYASPFAAVAFCEYAQYEDGSDATPDPCNFKYFDEQTGERTDPAAHYRNTLGEGPFAELEKLRAGIAKVLAEHGVVVLDQAILDLPASHLKADGDVFLEGKRISAGDAFFFRGV